MDFYPPHSHIHVIARALLSQGDHFYLCRAKSDGHFFLPGGHVEDGELAEKALLRELQEETGRNAFRVDGCIGTCENIFSEHGKGKLFQHEVNFVFAVSLLENEPIASQEAHIEYVTVKKTEIGNYPLEPEALQRGILNWLSHQASFFESYKENS